MGVSLCGGLRCTQATHAGLFNPPGLLGGIRENTLLQNIDIAAIPRLYILCPKLRCSLSKIQNAAREIPGRHLFVFC